MRQAEVAVIILGGLRHQDNLADCLKTFDQGASPQGRGFEPHSCYQLHSVRGSICANTASGLCVRVRRRMDTWCAGITPAQHAGGIGFNRLCVHVAACVALFAFALNAGARSVWRTGIRMSLPHCVAVL